MGKSDKKQWILIGAAVALIATVASLVIYFTTSYSSMTMAMLEIMEDDPTNEATNEAATEEPGSEEPDPDTPIPEERTGIDTDLYAKLLSLDWDSIPDDLSMADFQWNPAPFTSSGWSAKAYLYAYMLAMEICLRDEINPLDSEVIITPETLISKWLSEDANLCIPDGTYCMWSGQNQNVTECIGPYAMNGQYYTLETYNTGYGCIYISRLENSDLDEDKRVIIGLPSEIRQGNARYVTSTLYKDKYSALPTCSLADIKSSIKQGTIATQASRAIRDRPSVTYLPDAMYMTALSVRLGIEGRTLDQAGTGGCSYPYLKDLKGLLKYASKDTGVASECILAGAYNQFAGLTFCKGWKATDSLDITTGTGLYYQICKYLIQNNKSPIVVVNTSDPNDASITTAVERFNAGAGYFARYVLTGISDGTNIHDFVDALHNASSSSYSTITLDMKSKYSNYSSAHSVLTVGLSYTDNIPDYIESVYAAHGTDKHNLIDMSFGNDLGEKQGYATTGLSVINGSGIYKRICADQVDYAFKLYGDIDLYNKLSKQYASTSDVITGLDCLGSECLHDYAPKTIVCSLYSQMNKNMYKETTMVTSSAISILADVQSPDVYYVTGGVTAEGYANKFSHLTNPLHVTCYYPGSYDGHPGLDISGFETGTEIYAVDTGVIVSIFSYPYNVAAARTAAGETDYKFLGGAWTKQSAYGNSVVTMHKDKNGNYYYVMYGHLDSFAHIKLGAVVDKNTVLGYAGCTGKSTGTHLHIELRPASNSYLQKNELYAYDANFHPSNYTANAYIRNALNGDYDD